MPSDETTKDPKLPEAKEELLAFFDENRKEVYYERQLAVLFEDQYFHWITTQALHELVDEGKLKSELMPLEAGEGTEEVEARFYRAPMLRSWRRKARRKVKLVREVTALGKAMGAQAELLFDAALAGVGFTRTAIKVREYGGRRWRRTGHDLDRVYERDGLAWGAEIKNRLRYIGADELYLKLGMCEELGLRPLFIVRMMPASYLWEVEQRGGFVLIFKYQMFLLGHAGLAERVRQELGIKTGTEIFEKTARRFLEEGHLKHLREVSGLDPEGT